METILNLFGSAYAFFAAFDFYHTLYVIVLLGYPLVWLAAFALSRALRPVLGEKRPVEETVYRAWAIAFTAHLVLALAFGIDDAVTAWRDPRFLLGSRAFDGVLEVLVAFARLLPFLAVVALDLFFAIGGYRARLKVARRA